jgi:uncharacterized OB-fold protein
MNIRFITCEDCGLNFTTLNKGMRAKRCELCAHERRNQIGKVPCEVCGKFKKPDSKMCKYCRGNAANVKVEVNFRELIDRRVLDSNQILHALSQGK